MCLMHVCDFNAYMSMYHQSGEHGIGMLPLLCQYSAQFSILLEMLTDIEGCRLVSVVMLANFDQCCCMPLVTKMPEYSRGRL